MSIRFIRRFEQAVPAVALVAAAALAGCTDSDSSQQDTESVPTGVVDDMSAHGGKTCPKKLPQGSDASHGFGTDEPADSAPSLASPESAWVCRYYPTVSGTRSDGGTTFEWVRRGSVHHAESTYLATLARDLAELTPAKEGRACTDDLGLRWMLVYAHGPDLTGVVVDDFGCRDVRLTDDPFETVPGDANEAGTVSGVLAAPAGFLQELKEIRHP